jgi:hypothetical protein
MKRVLVTLVLALTGAAMAQGNPKPAQTASPATADQANTPTNQKVIKDQAEYNAYIAALQTQDPTQKAAAMEAFVTQYPNSVVKIDALEQAMQAYQQANNQAKVQETAARVLELNPNNLRALAIVTFIDRAQANTPEKAAKVRAEGEKGLQLLPDWKAPEGISGADFEKLRNQMTVIFAGAAGFGALQAKDYAAAKTFYLKSLAVDINNLQDVYQLGIAMLESNPIDKNGLWYIAKAYNLAQGNPAGQKSIGDYGRSKYRKYHGNYDGWDQLVAAAATQTAPGPEVAAITPAPTECELAVNAVKENDPATLSFGDWEFVLSHRDCSPANKEAADKVWQAIQTKQQNGEAKLKIPVKVTAATKDSIDAAITDENQRDNKADLHVTMDKPMVKVPTVGSTIDVIGVFASYEPNPFMFKMEKGELPAAAKPPATRKGAPTRPTRK